MVDCFEIIKDHTELSSLFEGVRGDNAKMREVAKKAVENLHGELNDLRFKVGLKKVAYTQPDRTKDIEAKRLEYQSKIDEVNKSIPEPNAVVIDEPNKSGEIIPLKENVNEGTDTKGGGAEEGGGGKKPPVEEGGIVVEDPETPFKKDTFVRARNRVGIDEFVDEGTTTHIAESTKAQRTIEKWKEDGTYAENIAEIQKRANDKDGSVSNQEQFIFAKHLADLDAAVNSIKNVFSPEYDKAHKKYTDALDAADNIRSKFGRGLGMIARNRGTAQSLADVMADIKEDKGVDVLTDAQKELAIKRYNDVKEALDKEAVLRIEAETKVAELEAENELLKKQKESKGNSKSEKIYKDGKRDFKAERQSLKDKLKEAKDEHFKDLESKGIKINSIAGGNIVLTNKMAKIILDIAKNHVDEIGVKLKEVTKRTLDDIKELLGDNISEKDIMDVLAGKYNKKKETKNEIQAQWYDLKQEAKLLVELDVLERGKEPTTEKGKIAKNQRLADIRKKIDDIKKQNGIGKYSDEAKIEASEKAAKKNVAELEEKIANNDLEFDKIDKPTSPQLEAYREKQKELRKQLEEKRKEAKVGKYSDENRFISTAKQRIAANKKIQAELQDRINKGDYAEKPQNQSILENTQFKEKYPRLYKEYEQSIIDKDKKAFEYEQKRINDKIKNYGWVEKFGHGVSIALHTSKGTVAIFDQSGLLVQLIQTTGSHPWETAKNVLPAIRDLFTNKWFDANMAKLKTSKYWDLLEKMGLPLYDTHSHDINFRNDLLGGDKNLMNRDITVKGKKFSIGKAFERSTATLFNNIRVKLAIDKIDQLHLEGKTWENAPEEFKAVARVISEFTGHGKVAKSFTNENWNLIIWSSKMMASTFNTLGLGDAIRPLPAARTISNDLAGTKFGKAFGLKEKAIDPKRSKGFYSSLTPQQRKFAAKEMSRFILSGATVMAAAYAKGKFLDDDDEKTTVDVNPLSTEFGTIKSGNKTVNVYGRYSSTVAAIAQITMGIRYLGGDKKDVLGDRFGDKSAGDVAFGKFGRGKMTPIAGLLYDVMFNNKKNYFTKEEITPTGALKQVAVPLAWQDLAKDIQREDPALSTALWTIFKIYGGNVRDERDYKKKQSIRPSGY